MDTITDSPIVAELLQDKQKLSAENADLKEQVQWLKEQLGLLKHRQFGPSSEKSDPAQEAMMFNEAEAAADPSVPEPEIISVSYTRRKSAVQKELSLDDLEVEDIEYVLSDDELVCPACEHDMLPMGEEIRPEIVIIPAKLKLVRHIRTKYSCRNCNHNNEIVVPIKIAPMPPVAFPGSKASASAVAYIMSQKFTEGLPLYRQEQSFKRQGLDLSRQTMANWMLKGAEWLAHIYARMREHLLNCEIIHADETTLQVLKEPGREATSQSYMWLYRTGRDGPPIALFEYQPSRAAEHPIAFLKGFGGYLNVDGYIAYDRIPNVTLVGCLAHARRKFNDALVVIPPSARRKGGTSAHKGLEFCDRLFEIERSLHDATAEERLAGRQKDSKPIMDAFAVWLDEQARTVTTKSQCGQAITYCRNQWKKLSVFLTDGRLEIDNNRSERTIKPFVIGRKNWLFANTPSGARASAIIYSVVETAKENGLDPLRYLTYIFEQLPRSDYNNTDALDAMLPWAEQVRNLLASSPKQ